jgi:hypothetical protein
MGRLVGAGPYYFHTYHTGTEEGALLPSPVTVNIAAVAVDIPAVVMRVP